MAGFIGVLIIVRPGVAGFNQFTLLALVSVLFCSLRDLATKQIPPHIPSLFITLLTTITVTTAGAVILFPLGGWTPPSAHRGRHAGAGGGAGADRLSMRDHGAAIRRHLRDRAVSLHRAAMGVAARLSRVRRRARRHDGAGRLDHRRCPVSYAFYREPIRHREVAASDRRGYRRTGCDAASAHRSCKSLSSEHR